MKYILILVFSLTIFLFAQTNDTTKSLSKAENNPTLADTGKTVLPDSLKQTVVDTLAPIYQKPLERSSFFIPRKQINSLDYRYAGDLLKPFDFYFTRDQGFIGQPNEILIYGAGFNSISFLQDGILFNNRFTNSLDLNLIQTEYIDSIEIVPLPRGFLYSPYNNNVTVNFIDRDFLSRPPLSRIKYYQGPNGEAFIDILFNSWMYKRFNASFDISNRRVDSSYSNTQFNLWQVRLKLKYMLSNKINIIGNYYYTTSLKGLNGGVDVAQIYSTTSNIDSLLYDQQLAPVVYPNRNESTNTHNISLKLLGKFTDNSKTNLTLYYRSNFDGISGGSDSTHFANTDRNKIYGLSLNQSFTLSQARLSLIGNYEKYDFNYDALYQSFHSVINYNASVYSLSAVVTFDSDNQILVPSLFCKASHNSYFTGAPNVSGYGIDMKANLSEKISFYGGYSFYNNHRLTDTKNFELSGQFKNDNTIAGIEYFLRKDFYKNSSPASGLIVHIPENSTMPYVFNNIFPSTEQNMSGIGGHFDFKFWKIISENSVAYYFDAVNSSAILSSVPKFTYRGGIFYKGLLFNGNLNLKSGIVFYYNDKRSAKINSVFPLIVAPNRRIDLTVTGIIQKVATIYFTWENLLNTQYFIVPYYPMPTRNIRFGIAWELFN